MPYQDAGGLLNGEDHVSVFRPRSRLNDCSPAPSGYSRRCSTYRSHLVRRWRDARREVERRVVGKRLISVQFQKIQSPQHVIDHQIPDFTPAAANFDASATVPWPNPSTILRSALRPRKTFHVQTAVGDTRYCARNIPGIEQFPAAGFLDHGLCFSITAWQPAPAAGR
jgi:hypothetical protein